MMASPTGDGMNDCSRLRRKSYSKPSRTASLTVWGSKPASFPLASRFLILSDDNSVEGTWYRREKTCVATIQWKTCLTSRVARLDGPNNRPYCTRSRPSHALRSGSHLNPLRSLPNTQSRVSAWSRGT